MDFLFEFPGRHLVPGEEFGHQPVVLRLVQGTVEVIVVLGPIAGAPVGHVHVHGLAVDDGRDGVVEIQASRVPALVLRPGDDPGRESARVPERSGPAASTMRSNPSSSGESRDGTSWRTTSISGRDSIFSVTYCENRSRSTARALPAGMRVASAASMTRLPSSRISSLSTPTALPRSSERKELEQTSSASPGLTCASENTSGFISNKRTDTPARASSYAHSHPASPPPMMATLLKSNLPFSSFAPGTEHIPSRLREVWTV